MEKSTDFYVSKNIEENLSKIKKVYSYPDNSDIKIREFKISLNKKEIKSFIVFIEGLCNSAMINESILKPLMLLSSIPDNNKKDEFALIKEVFIPHNQINEVRKLSEITDQVNFGCCAVFVDGYDISLIADVKGWSMRGISEPKSESVVKGSHEGFNENMRINTALIRKTLKDENLICEMMSIGRKSKTPLTLMYIKSIVNDSLINEAKKRLSNIKMDYVFSSGQIEQLIEENTFDIFPHSVSTERPDKAAEALSEGKVIILLQGSPEAVIIPATLPEMMSSVEDHYLRFSYVNFTRILRIIAIVFSFLLPGLYVAIVNFHPEMIPTDLLFAIEASGEKVPLSSAAEIILMEISFDIIREASIRVPSKIGQTLSIVGALILGQAAVAANIVSPISIIIVSLTGLGSYVTPSYLLSFAFRLSRYVYTVLGAMFGFFGLSVFLFIQLMSLSKSKSFGVSLLTLYDKNEKNKLFSFLLSPPIFKRKDQPSYVRAKTNNKED